MNLIQDFHAVADTALARITLTWDLIQAPAVDSGGKLVTDSAGNQLTVRPPVSAYRIRRATDAAFTQNVAVFDSNSVIRQYLDNGLNITARYWYQILARNADGTYPASWDEAPIAVKGFIPIPSFSLPASVFVGEIFAVDNTSTGRVTQSEWDFDNDGHEESIAFEPSFAYRSAGTKTVKLTVGNIDGLASITHTIVVNPSFLAQYFEEFQLTKVFNITNLNLKMPLLEANFGAGYGAGVLTAPASGLRVWSISSELVPDIDQYQISYTVDDDQFTDTRFQYVWEFFRRHIALGNKPFYFTDPRTGRRFLASFVESQISFEAMTAKLFRGGLLIRQRRVKLDGLTYRADDASVEQY